MLRIRIQGSSGDYCTYKNNVVPIRAYYKLRTSRAVDPHSFYADPDPAVFLNADPDPGLA